MDTTSRIFLNDADDANVRTYKTRDRTGVQSPEGPKSKQGVLKTYFLLSDLQQKIVMFRLQRQESDVVERNFWSVYLSGVFECPQEYGRAYHLCSVCNSWLFFYAVG